MIKKQEWAKWANDYERRQRIFMLVSIYQQTSKAVTNGEWVSYPEPKVTLQQRKWRLVFDKPFHEGWQIVESLKDILGGRWKS